MLKPGLWSGATRGRLPHPFRPLPVVVGKTLAADLSPLTVTLSTPNSLLSRIPWKIKRSGVIQQGPLFDAEVVHRMARKAVDKLTPTDAVRRRKNFFRLS